MSLSMAVSPDCALAGLISAYLEVIDLCALDASSRDVSIGVNQATWLTAAARSGLDLVDLDKSSAKAIFGAVSHLAGRPPIIRLHSNKSARELAKAAQMMTNEKIKHLKCGGFHVGDFVTRFQFTHEGVNSYLADQRVAVSSFPVQITLGDIRINIVLTWRGGTMWFHTHVAPGVPFQPFRLHLRAVSSPLTMRKEFKVYANVAEQQGSGICCLLKSPAAFAENMQAGIVCVGLVSDLNAIDTSGGRANSLHLDIPGWKTQSQAFAFNPNPWVTGLAN